MQEPQSTNRIRQRLEGMGAVKPGRRAVRMIATYVQTDGKTDYWELMYPDCTIERAVQACQNLKGDQSYVAFYDALHASQAT